MLLNQHMTVYRQRSLIIIGEWNDEYSLYRTKQEPESTALIGYSLGGLASLYALYTSGAFGKVGSLSGSLWFEGWKVDNRKYWR